MASFTIIQRKSAFLFDDIKLAEDLKYYSFDGRLLSNKIENKRNNNAQ